VFTAIQHCSLGKAVAGLCPQATTIPLILREMTIIRSTMPGACLETAPTLAQAIEEFLDWQARCHPDRRAVHARQPVIRVYFTASPSVPARSWCC
jgi:hypothetical protein